MGVHTISLGKSKYICPKIILMLCVPEESICAASATITIEDLGATNNPEIEDWTTGSTTISTYEF